jgi:hypothetical protein
MELDDLQKDFSGYCPILKREHTIQVLYTLIKIDNAPSLYKAYAFDCGNMEKCTYDICPIGDKIPDLFEADA